MTGVGVLEGLESECVALCREHGWLDANGAPAFQMICSDRVTFSAGADLMLLAIHPRGDPSVHDGVSRESGDGSGYTALLDDSWGEREPGGAQLQAVAREVAGMFSSDAEAVLRRTPAGFMIPFRSESIARLPDPLRKQGLLLGGRLVASVRPKVLVLVGGDRVLFESAVSRLPGRRSDSMAEAFGATRRAYRDVLVAGDDGVTFAAVLPLSALQAGLDTLRRRLQEHRLIPMRH